jgi:hypothetical protein
VKDLDGMGEWLRNHWEMFSTAKSALIVNGEASALRRLLDSDHSKALDHALSLPPSLASKAIDQTFHQRSDLLSADEAIGFLRQALHGENHEALVGHVCGLQLYSKGDEGMRAFFRDHTVTPPSARRSSFKRSR